MKTIFSLQPFNMLFKYIKNQKPVTAGNHPSKYSIIAQDFLENSDETYFKIHKKGTSKTLSLTAKNFATNKNLLKLFTPEDAYLIGYIFASEVAAREKKVMRSLKDSDQ